MVMEYSEITHDVYKFGNVMLSSGPKKSVVIPEVSRVVTPEVSRLVIP